MESELKFLHDKSLFVSPTLFDLPMVTCNNYNKLTKIFQKIHIQLNSVFQKIKILRSKICEKIRYKFV